MCVFFVTIRLAVPLGAVGGVVWGLLSSFGAGIANASPTFKFSPYYLEHYYGSTTNAVTLVVMSFVKQGVVQVRMHAPFHTYEP